MTIKPFAIQGADLTLGGVNLQAGTTGVVIPGVTQATNYFVDEAEKISGTNPNTFGSSTSAVTVIDNSRYLALTGTSPSGSYVPAEYSVGELEGGRIQEINVEVAGVFAAADKTRAEASNMWATTDSTPFTSFTAGNWTQIPYRPKVRAGEIQTIGGGGGGDTLTSENEDYTAVMNNSGNFQVSGSNNSARVEAYYDSNGGYSTAITPDGLELVWGGNLIGTLSKGPGGWTIGAEAGKGINLTTSDMSNIWAFGSDGSITFPDNTIQTTAYTGQGGGDSGGSLTGKLWIAAGSNPGAAASLSSTTGTSWTINDFNLSGYSINRVAISPTKIVYLMHTNGPSDAIYYANTPDENPTMAAGTDSFGEGAPVEWREVNYLGGKFVAVGGFTTTNNTVSTGINAITLAGGGRTHPRITLDNINYNFSGQSITISGATNTELNGTFVLQYNSADDLRSGVYDMYTEANGVPTITSTSITGATVADITGVDGASPLFAYSSDGVNWTYGDLDYQGYMGSDGTLGYMKMSDVAYDGTGYLIPVIATAWDNQDQPFVTTSPGAFYITDITAFVSEPQFIYGGGPGGLPGNFNNIAAYGDGTFFVSDDDYTVWTGNPNDGWADHNIIPTLITAYGWTPGGDNTPGNDIDSAVAGSVGLNQCFVATTNEGMVISTTNQGSTFNVSIPERLTGTATRVSSNPITLDFGGDPVPYEWEKITITVANGDDTRWNGVYYVYPGANPGEGVLYDGVEGNTINGSTWTNPANPMNIAYSRGAPLDFIAVGDESCVVISNDLGKLYRSTDLINWTVVAENWGPYGINDIYYSDRLSITLDRLASGDYEVVLNSDGVISLPGGLALPTLTTVNWQDYNETAPTLQLSNDPTNQVIITGPTPNSGNLSAQRIVIQGQQGYGGENNGKGEGGDVYIWAGSGGDGGSIYPRGDGGDVKLRGGLGGNNGGYIRIESGDSQATNGTGGFLELHSGDGGGSNSTGGYVEVRAGGGTHTGGDVDIISGQGNTTNGQVRINIGSGAHQWTFRNDGVLALPPSGDIVDSNGDSVLGGGSGAELIGDSSSAGTGFEITVYTDWNGQQGGEEDGATEEDWFAPNDVTGVEVGDIITFRQGEIRTITGVSTSGGQTVLSWSGAVTGSDALPRYPLTITSNDYSAPEKNKARIKPDLTAANDWGHYMDIYAGGNSPVIDNKHIHMAGHNSEVELFLGTDNNYVSAKEAGSAPAGVRLHSENEVSVEGSNLRINRKGSSWAAVYGDGKNFSPGANNADLTFGPITVDEHGDYYVGGEHVVNNDPNAIISKYGRDGNLIWSKYNSDSVTVSAWDIKAIAYHNGEVASVVSTNYGKSTAYLKLMVQDSTTGEIKSTRDIYDYDGNINAKGMTYHPTLGWAICGKTYGETLVTASITGGAGCGVGVVELPLDQTRLDNVYPSLNHDWFISGTNITGEQYLGTGLGMYQNVAVTTVTGAGADAVVRVTAVYIDGGFYQDLNVTTQGTNYTSGDQLKILGSLLGGVDGGFTLGPITPFSVNPGSSVMVQFSKSTYPNLYNQINWASFTVAYNAQTYDVLGVGDSGDGYWNVTINSSDANISTLTFYTANGNDALFTAVASGGSLTAAYNGAVNGIASRKTFRIDLGFTLGYTSTNFAGGTFTLSRHLNSQPWVWTSTWARYLAPPDTYGTGTAYVVENDPFTNCLVVGGYMDGVTGNYSFVWKLNTNGTTNWLRNIVGDQSGVYGLAVSKVDGSIYATTNNNGNGTINKLTVTGLLEVRKSGYGPWGMDPRVKIEMDLDGNEYVYVGGQGGGMFAPMNSLMLSKFTSNLQLIWGRNLGYAGGESIQTNYDDTYSSFVLGKGQATLVGYAYMFTTDHYNGAIFTMDTTDNFTPVDNDWWYASTHADMTWSDVSADWISENMLPGGVEVKTSNVSSDTGISALPLVDWRFQERVINLNGSKNGILGVESIGFADGNELDHNPVDIPPSVVFDPNVSWNYTLQLSDRGRFITNQPIPNVSYVNNLFITVPRNDVVQFPVGTVITLINANSDTNGGYRIYVQPSGYGDPNAPQIWATGGNQNPSTWSFLGIQTATLMKISSNGWLLTANDITNED